MEIKKLTEISADTVATFNNLLAQLSPDCKLLSEEYLIDIVNSTHTTIFVVEKNNMIIGTFTFITYKIPSGSKALIEDVIVNNKYRGGGIGKAMIDFAINYALEIGINQIDLTSNPTRIAANTLYQKLGFVKRDTNVYRLILK